MLGTCCDESLYFVLQQTMLSTKVSYIFKLLNSCRWFQKFPSLLQKRRWDSIQGAMSEKKEYFSCREPLQSSIFQHSLFHVLLSQWYRLRTLEYLPIRFKFNRRYSCMVKIIQKIFRVFCSLESLTLYLNISYVEKSQEAGLSTRNTILLKMETFLKWQKKLSLSTPDYISWNFIWHWNFSFAPK